MILNNPLVAHHEAFRSHPVAPSQNVSVFVITELRAAQAHEEAVLGGEYTSAGERWEAISLAICEVVDLPHEISVSALACTSPIERLELLLGSMRPALSEMAALSSIEALGSLDAMGPTTLPSDYELPSDGEAGTLGDGSTGESTLLPHLARLAQSHTHPSYSLTATLQMRL